MTSEPTSAEAWENLVAEVQCFAETCADGGVDTEDEGDLGMVSMLGAIADYAERGRDAYAAAKVREALAEEWASLI